MTIRNLSLINFILIAGLLLTSTPANTQNISGAGDNIEAKVLTSNLSNPWELLWGPDGKLWVTERDGKVSKVDPVSGKATLIADIDEVKSRGEGGLLGMVLHPDFSRTPQVFLAFNYEGSGYKEKIVRYTYNGTTLVNPVVLLDNIPAAGIHNGCRLAISPDGKLFVTTGDASRSNNAQDKSSLSGKVLRINLDGTIPSDNPIPNSPLWSFGHRNPQGLVFVKNRLYASEHGPNNDDEVNIILKGRNYGWPEITGACDERSERNFCEANNIAEPIQAWTPTVAACGLDYYNSSLIRDWKNSLLMVSLKESTLFQLRLNDAGDKVTGVKEYLRGKYGRLRDVCVAPDGNVYIATSNGSNDKIIRISAKK